MTIMDCPRIITYKSDNAPSSHLMWLACYFGAGRGEAIPFNFTGTTEAEAKKKAEDWWNNRQQEFIAIKNKHKENVNLSETIDDSPQQEVVTKSRKREGSIWVVNSKNERKRISPEELNDYMKAGFIRGRDFK